MSTMGTLCALVQVNSFWLLRHVTLTYSVMDSCIEKLRTLHLVCNRPPRRVTFGPFAIHQYSATSLCMQSLSGLYAGTKNSWYANDNSNCLSCSWHTVLPTCLILSSLLNSCIILCQHAKTFKQHVRIILVKTSTTLLVSCIIDHYIKSWMTLHNTVIYKVSEMHLATCWKHFFPGVQCVQSI